MQLLSTCRLSKPNTSRYDRSARSCFSRAEALETTVFSCSVFALEATVAFCPCPFGTEQAPFDHSGCASSLGVASRAQGEIEEGGGGEEEGLHAPSPSPTPYVLRPSLYLRSLDSSLAPLDHAGGGKDHQRSPPSLAVGDTARRRESHATPTAERCIQHLNSIECVSPPFVAPCMHHPTVLNSPPPRPKTPCWLNPTMI